MEAVAEKSKVKKQVRIRRKEEFIPDPIPETGPSPSAESLQEGLIKHVLPEDSEMETRNNNNHLIEEEDESISLVEDMRPATPGPSLASIPPSRTRPEVKAKDESSTVALKLPKSRDSIHSVRSFCEDKLWEFLKCEPRSSYVPKTASPTQTHLKSSNMDKKEKEPIPKSHSSPFFSNSVRNPVKNPDRSYFDEKQSEFSNLDDPRPCTVQKAMSRRPGQDEVFGSPYGLGGSESEGKSILDLMASKRAGAAQSSGKKGVEGGGSKGLGRPVQIVKTGSGTHELFMPPKKFAKDDLIMSTTNYSLYPSEWGFPLLTTPTRHRTLPSAKGAYLDQDFYEKFNFLFNQIQPSSPPPKAISGGTTAHKQKSASAKPKGPLKKVASEEDLGDLPASVMPIDKRDNRQVREILTNHQENIRSLVSSLKALENELRTSSASAWIKTTSFKEDKYSGLVREFIRWSKLLDEVILGILRPLKFEKCKQFEYEIPEFRLKCMKTLKGCHSQLILSYDKLRKLIGKVGKKSLLEKSFPDLLQRIRDDMELFKGSGSIVSTAKVLNESAVKKKYGKEKERLVPFQKALALSKAKGRRERRRLDEETPSVPLASLSLAKRNKNRALPPAPLPAIPNPDPVMASAPAPEPPNPLAFVPEKKMEHVPLEVSWKSLTAMIEEEEEPPVPGLAPTQPTPTTLEESDLESYNTQLIQFQYLSTKKKKERQSSKEIIEEACEEEEAEFVADISDRRTIQPSKPFENMAAELRFWARTKRRQIGTVGTRVSALFRKKKYMSPTVTHQI